MQIFLFRVLSIGVNLQIVWSIAEISISIVKFLIDLIEFLDWIALNWHPCVKVISVLRIALDVVDHRLINRFLITYNVIFTSTQN